MPTVTLTTTGVQKIAGLYGNGNGATYVTTVTAGTATVKKFDVRRRPIRGGAASVVGSAGNSQTVTYTETARFDFELEVWADVSVAGTVVVTQTKSGETDQINMAAYLLQSESPLNTMICLGDSITSRLDTPSGSGQVSLSTSFLAWASARLNASVRCLNAGVSGNTTAQMLARYSTDIVGVDAKYLHVLGGGNDVSVTTTAAEILTTISNLSNMVAAARLESRIVLLGTIYPFGTHTAAIQRAAIQQINAWVRQQASENVWVVDYYGAMVDASGAIRSNYLVSDNIHPSSLGASAMANALVSVMTNILVPRQQLLSSSLWDADNACRHGVMVGDNASGANGWTVSAGVTGNGPSQWSASRTGAIVAVTSKQPRSVTVPAADFTRIAITTSGVDDSYVRIEYGLNMRLWSSSGTANGIRRFYVPSTGSQYDVLVAGNLAVADDTATWPTAIGSVFTTNTATLMCVPPLIVGSVIRLAVECVVSGVSVGQVMPEATAFLRNAASTSLAAATSIQNSLVATDGAAPLAADITAGMVLETPAVTIPAGWDLENTTTSAGPSLTTRLNIYVRNSALATVDWGRATVRVS